MVDLLANAINKIKVYESMGINECMIPSTKPIKAVLEVMKKNNYIQELEEVEEGKFKQPKVSLSKKINDVGVIKPRHAVNMEEFQRYEKRYIPSRDFGILIVSTSKGIMTNREARENHVGGRLLAYVY